MGESLTGNGDGKDDIGSSFLVKTTASPQGEASISAPLSLGSSLNS